MKSKKEITKVNLHRNRTKNLKFYRDIDEVDFHTISYCVTFDTLFFVNIYTK